MLSFALAGSPPLWEADEGRCVHVALETLRLDDLMVPHLLHDAEHFTTPRLTHWLVADRVSLVGHHECAVRLPGAVC